MGDILIRGGTVVDGTGSEEFRAVHREAGQSKPLYLDHPQFEGFEVIQTVQPGQAAVA